MFYLCKLIFIFLRFRYLSTGLSFRNLATTIRMGVSTLSYIIHNTCITIWEELVDEFMPTPRLEQLRNIAEDYRKRWNFPNCIGAIDGKHCQIKCPTGSGSTYFNYMKYFSILLQGVADANKKFIAIEVGARGKQSDGGVFASSTLFNLIENNNFNIPPPKELPNINIKVPHVLVGDEAYPLKSYLMRPFPSRNLNPLKENFNKRLSSARKCIECTFGILRAKWRILGKDIEVQPDKAIAIIKCTCPLHNVVRERDGDNDPDYFNIVTDSSNNTKIQNSNFSPTTDHHGARRSTNEAKEIRDTLANYFLEN